MWYLDISLDFFVFNGIKFYMYITITILYDLKTFDCFFLLFVLSLLRR
jgi:hypothetical protein